jgi:tetratricopeptide (TPR) repeat protein
VTTYSPRPAGSTGPAGRVPPWRLALAAGLVLVFAASATLAVRALGHATRTTAPRAGAGGSSTLANGIESLRKRLDSASNDWRGWATLGSAYVQQARITEDPSNLSKAERALRRSLQIRETGNAGALAGLGALAASRHDFSGALAWAEKGRAIAPNNATIYGVLGDALIELGRYPEAFAALQRMVDLRPGLSSYARASYAWELQGNVPNATRALELALQAAPTPNDAAFASYYLGELAWNTGRLDAAAEWYRQSAARDPSFLPATQGLAKVDAARSNYDEAIQKYEAVVTKLPIPQYFIDLGDLYELTGRHDLAQRQFELLAEQERLLRANGENVDLERAVFAADHQLDVAGGLAAAQREWDRRKSVVVADALGWTLYAAGRYHEALPYAQKALRLGTRSASFYFHKGMIERALGMQTAAIADLREALAINSYFSPLWAPRVRQMLG